MTRVLDKPTPGNGVWITCPNCGTEGHANHGILGRWDPKAQVYMLTCCGHQADMVAIPHEFRPPEAKSREASPQTAAPGSDRKEV